MLIGWPTLVIGAWTPAALIWPGDGGLAAGGCGCAGVRPVVSAGRCGNRRLVGQRARNAACADGVALAVSLVLLAADADFRRRGVRAVGFGRLLGLREIDIGGDLDLGVARSDDRRQDVFDALDDAFSISCTYLICVGSRPASISLLFSCESMAPLWSMVTLETGRLRHAGGDQVLDAGDLRRFQRRARGTG